MVRGATALFLAVAACSAGSVPDAKAPAQEKTDVPTEVAAPAGPPVVREVVAANDTTCALRSDGKVACWGAEVIPSAQHRGVEAAAPVQVPGVEGAEALAGGNGFWCVLTEGRVACWGRNDLHQLGQTFASHVEFQPQAVGGVEGATSIAAGGAMACASTPGALLCWGGAASAPPVTREAFPLRRLPAVQGELGVGGDTVCGLSKGKPARCWRGTKDWVEQVTDPAAAISSSEKFVCLLVKDRVQCVDYPRGREKFPREVLSFSADFIRGCFVAPTAASAVPADTRPR